MNIMIMGDSWACGEWGLPARGDYQVLHPGTAGYLREAGYDVISIARGGHSNSQQMEVLAQTPHHADIVIWFVTDPMRDLTRQPTTLTAFQDHREGLLRESIRRLDQLWRGPTLVVGGLGRVRQAQCPSRWRVVCEDLTRWLVPASRVEGSYLGRGWRFPDCDPELLTHHEHGESEAVRFRSRAEHDPTSDEHRWFWPDGAHPNRWAHERLCRELIMPAIVQATD